MEHNGVIKWEFERLNQFWSKAIGWTITSQVSRTLVVSSLDFSLGDMEVDISFFLVSAIPLYELIVYYMLFFCVHCVTLLSWR